MSGSSGSSGGGGCVLEPGVIYDIGYHVPPIHPGDEPEAGNIRAFWTGEIDTWGKYTIRCVDGGPTFYLFAREMTSADRVY